MRTTGGRFRVQSQGHAADQRRLWRYGLPEGASFGTPWLLEENIRQEEAPYLCICPSIHLSTNNKLWAPFKNKIRDIFLWRSVLFVHWIFVNRGYTTICPKKGKKGHLLKLTNLDRPRTYNASGISQGYIVIDVKNGHSDSSSNPKRNYFPFR